MGSGFFMPKNQGWLSYTREIATFVNQVRCWTKRNKRWGGVLLGASKKGFIAVSLLFLQGQYFLVEAFVERNRFL